MHLVFTLVTLVASVGGLASLFWLAGKWPISPEDEAGPHPGGPPLATPGLPFCGICGTDQDDPEGQTQVCLDCGEDFGVCCSSWEPGFCKGCCIKLEDAVLGGYA